MPHEILYATVAVLVIAFVVPAGMLLTAFLGPKSSYSRARGEAFESGIGNVIGSTNQKFSVKYYLVAILFLIFDIETVFMLPWAVSLRDLGWFGFWEMVVFMLLLLCGLVYVIRKGVLQWR